MSTTTTTETSSQQAPELTILHRVVSIPMISSSLETLNDALSSNAYTRSPYSTAKGLSSTAYNTAYKYTEPLQIRLAPLLVRADGYANKAVDAVEQRYPYPFKAKPEEVADYVKQTRRTAADYVHEKTVSVNKTIDEKVKTPAYNVAQGIDQRFSPIVDYFEVAVHKLQNGSAPATPNGSAESKYQYQRALAISKELKDHIYGYSNDQIKQIQAHSALVQRANETAQSITALASTSYGAAQSRIHTLSETMVCELQRLQASTAALATSLSTSASNKIQHTIPPQLQKTYTDLADSLSKVIADMKETATDKDLPIQDKVGRIGKQVRETVTPLLDTVKKGVENLMTSAKAKVAEQTNGHAQPQNEEEVRDQ